MNKVLVILINIYITLSINAQTTEPILRLNTEMHTAGIRRIGVDAQDKYILTASTDKTAKLWSITTGNLLKTFRPPIGYENEGILTAGTLSPNGKIAVVTGRTGYEWDKKYCIYIFNTSTGKLIQRLTGLDDGIVDLEFSIDGNYLSAALLGPEGVVIYKKNGGTFIHHITLTDYSKPVLSIAFDNIGRLATVSLDGKIRLYNNNFDLIYETIGAGNMPVYVAFSTDGNKIAVGYEDSPEIEIFSGKHLKLLYKAELDGMNKNAGLGYGLSFSTDGEFLYAGGWYNKEIDGSWWGVIRKWSNAGAGTYTDYPAFANSVSDIKAKQNGDVIFASTQPDLGILNKYGNKFFYKAGDINYYKSRDQSHFKINNSGNEIAFASLSKKAVQFSVSERNLKTTLDLSDLSAFTDNKPSIKVTNWKDTDAPQINGKELSFFGQYEGCISTDISNDASKIVFGTTGNIYCTDANGNKLWKTNVQGTAYSVNISGNGKYIASAQDGGIINWYRMSDGELILTLYAHPDNKRWILFTPDGYFDATQGTEELAGWHINQGADKEAKFYPLSQFYEQYYTPNLGARVLAGEKITSENNIKEDFKLPPLVKITSPPNNSKHNKKEIQVTVKVTDQGGGIDEIRLYLNNKLVESTQRGFIKTEQKNSSKTRIFKITLSYGKNIIKATAFNKQRTEALPDEIVVFYNGTKKTTNLHMLVIGIDSYKNPRYKLNYALADATAFKKEVEKGCNTIFSTVNIVFLKDSEATKLRIFQEFNKLKSTAKPEDVFIFYYAGHGVMSEEEKSRFHIILYDVTQLYGNNELLKNKAISANELQRFSTLLKAQKQLFVLDACQSGGMVEMLAKRGAAEEKAISQLARSTGTFWLTASNSEQFATEFKELGHGIFTYAVILGLQGQADGSSKDKKITVKELSAFLNDKVPELSEKYKGQIQYPTSYGYGQDFPIIIIK